MNTTTNRSTQCLQSQHYRIFNIDTPRNSCTTNIGRHSYQVIKQDSHSSEFFVCEIKMVITRIRLVMHDACLLAIKNNNPSLAPICSIDLDADELYFWKRHSGVISNG